MLKSIIVSRGGAGGGGDLLVRTEAERQTIPPPPTFLPERLLNSADIGMSGEGSCRQCTSAAERRRDAWKCCPRGDGGASRVGELSPPSLEELGPRSVVAVNSCRWRTACPRVVRGRDLGLDDGLRLDLTRRLVSGDEDTVAGRFAGMTPMAR